MNKIVYDSCKINPFPIKNKKKQFLSSKVLSLNLCKLHLYINIVKAFIYIVDVCKLLYIKKYGS